MFIVWCISGFWLFSAIGMIVTLGLFGAIIAGIVALGLLLYFKTIDRKNYKDKLKKTYPKGTSREYKFFDKRLTKAENSEFFNSQKDLIFPRSHILRNRKKLTPEQLEELLKRYDNLKK